MTFKRELRYFVFKLSDLSLKEQTTLNMFAEATDLTRRTNGKQTLECVVVESDWPEYEPTWDAIQRRMEGRPTREAELQAELLALSLKVEGLETVQRNHDRLVEHFRCQISSIQAANECNYKGKLAAESERNRFRAVLETIDAMDVHQPITAQEAEMRKLVAQALAEQTSSHPLDCRVEGKRIAVYVGFDELAFAATHHPDFWDGESTEDVPNIKVADVAMFAKEVVRELNREEEDGSTLVTRLLDEAVKNAVEDGCDGVDHG